MFIWELTMPPPPHEVVRSETKCTLSIGIREKTCRPLHIRFGDVWITMGQSNVVMPLRTIKDWKWEREDGNLNLVENELKYFIV